MQVSKDQRQKVRNKKEKSNARGINKAHLHTTIHPSTYNKLKELSLKYGSMSQTLEHAIRLLTIHHEDSELLHEELEDTELANLLQNKFNMVLVARRTFLSYIEKMPEDPIKDNNAKELVEWFTRKEITELTLEETMESLKKIWLAAKYFTDIIIEKIPLEGRKSMKLKVTISHNFNVTKYGEYWSQYFKYFFESLGYKVDFKVRNESFYLFITGGN